MNPLNKREFLKVTSLLGAGAAVPVIAAGDLATSHADPPAGSLLDANFTSDSVRRFGSQVIHHGEQNGFQVTPISQDKAAPGYQRPGNLNNPTVALSGDFPGVKVAKHWRGSPTDPDRLDRMPNAGDEKLVRDYLGKHLPSANGTTLAFKVCMYTWGGPWLGPLPGTKHVTIIAACDGGGFKFSSAYGEALADLATEGKTGLPVGFMKPA